MVGRLRSTNRYDKVIYDEFVLYPELLAFIIPISIGTVVFKSTNRVRGKLLYLVYGGEMILEFVENILAGLFIPAFILHILHHGWYKKYLLLVTRLCVYISQIVAGVIYGTILVAPKIVVGVMKAIIVSVIAIVLALVYLTTYIVPYFGEKAGGWKESVTNGAAISYFTIQVRQMREIMVNIVAEEEDRALNFEDPDKYRTELKRVKQDAKNRLETGETLLSILLGAVLLSTNFTGVRLLQSSIYEIPVQLLIEGWLLVIAVSIIYRSSALEFLAYSSEEDFDSLDTMDAALSYQKGISLVGFLQGLMFLLVFVAAISRVKFDLIEDALRAKYTDEPWVAFTWERLTN
ncbi:hypothetical protein [Halorubrum pallidum]